VTGRFPHVEDTARRIVATVLTSPATLGEGRLVCVDGPAGSGKTTLAAALRRGFRAVLGGLDGPPSRDAVALVHMDDVYAGWGGLDAGRRTVAADVVEPLRHGRPGRYRRYDWHRDAFAEEHVVGPVDVLLLEGVGSGNAAYGEAITCLVWVETGSALRLQRGLDRDGSAMRGHWLAWGRQEDAMFERERTRERADLVVDGATSRLQET
jgi:energy-coupling factor transporter ATP-binding protein EcfA2